MLYERPDALMDERSQESGHIPVLYEAVLSGLAASSRAGWYVDGTFGAGGHTRGILEANAENKVFAMDQDADAIERANSFKKDYGERFEIRRSNFEAMDQLPDLGYCGVLLDLGVSSYHLDEAERGFSFRKDGPLDMRMDRSCGMTAEQFLETASERDLVRAIRDYGEEPQWRRVVKAIIENRGLGCFERTLGFAEWLRGVMKINPGKRGIDPATRTFQGIRIFINDELGVIERVLPKAFDLLMPGGRLAVISFHSLEDRIVKRVFREWAGVAINKYDRRPQQERNQLGALITRKPIMADEEEIKINPRSRTAKLRIVEKLS